MRAKKLLILLPFIAVLVSHIIWGANFVAVKMALAEFPVMTLAFLRFGLAVILLTPFILKYTPNHFRFRLSDAVRIVAAGLCLTTINIAFFFEGIQHSEAIAASVLSLLTPILSLLACWWFLKEKVYWINLVGVLTGMLGALFVIGLPLILAGSFITTNLVGNALLLLSCVSSVIGLLLLRDLLKRYQPMLLSFIFFMIAAVSFAIPAYFDYQTNPDWLSNVGIIGFMSLLYITLLSTIAAYFLQVWGIKKIGIIHGNLFQYIEPAIAATLAVPLLGERISYSFIVGTCLVVLGCYWGTLGKPEHHHITHRHHKN